MIIRVLAPALSHPRPALRLAGPAGPVIGRQGRRVARTAARGRRTAPHPYAAPAQLGRLCSLRRADPALAREAAEASAGYPRHRPALAPPPRRPQMDLPAPRSPGQGRWPSSGTSHLVSQPAPHQPRRRTGQVNDTIEFPSGTGSKSGRDMAAPPSGGAGGSRSCCAGCCRRPPGRPGSR
jgi:hypothetical protein